MNSIYQKTYRNGGFAFQSAAPVDLVLGDGDVGVLGREPPNGNAVFSGFQHFRVKLGQVQGVARVSKWKNGAKFYANIIQ